MHRECSDSDDQTGKLEHKRSFRFKRLITRRLLIQILAACYRLISPSSPNPSTLTPSVLRLVDLENRMEEHIDSIFHVFRTGVLFWRMTDSAHTRNKYHCGGSDSG